MRRLPLDRISSFVRAQGYSIHRTSIVPPSLLIEAQYGSCESDEEGVNSVVGRPWSVVY